MKTALTTLLKYFIFLLVLVFLPVALIIFLFLLIIEVIVDRAFDGW